jgi:hypothetical protein
MMVFFAIRFLIGFTRPARSVHEVRLTRNTYTISAPVFSWPCSGRWTEISIRGGWGGEYRNMYVRFDGCCGAEQGERRQSSTRGAKDREGPGFRLARCTPRQALSLIRVKL